MDEDENTYATFAEGAAALIAETLYVYDRMKQLRQEVNSSVDANLSSLLLTEGLDQLIAANLQGMDDECSYRRIAFEDSSNKDSSVNTTHSTVVTVPTSASVLNSQVSFTNHCDDEQRKDVTKVGETEKTSSHSVCSNNKAQTKVVEEENSHSSQRFKDPRYLSTHPKKYELVKGKNERKVWSRQNLKDMLRKMKETLSAMEQQLLGCESENSRNLQMKKENQESLVVKRPKKERNKYLSNIGYDSSFSEGLERIATDRKETSNSMSYATIENMSAYWLGDNNDRRENLLNELQSITKFFLRTLRNDWGDILPSDLKSEKLLEKSHWNSSEVIQTLTTSIQFLCGRSAAIIERESCLEAEMHRLEEFERELNAREAAVKNKENNLIKLGGSQQEHNEAILSQRKGQDSDFGALKKQTVMYLSIPASKITNSRSGKDSEDSLRTDSEPNHELCNLRSRVHMAEQRLKKLYNHLALSNKRGRPSVSSTMDSNGSRYESTSMLSGAESSIRRKNSVISEVEDLRTELLHHYSTLQNSLTEALKNISCRIEEQRNNTAHADSEKSGAVKSLESQSVNALRNMENSSCCLDSPSLLEALSVAEKEWIRRLEVLKTIISQNGGQLKQNISGIDSARREETSGNVTNKQKLNDFVLAFVRENEALDMYWKRALDSIPEQLEQTSASETVFS